MQTAREDIAKADVMMGRHDEMRQFGLRNYLAIMGFVDEAVTRANDAL